MKVLLCGYRDWAFDAFDKLRTYSISEGNEHEFTLVTSREGLDVAMSQPHDLAIVVGWSWKVSPEHLRSVPFVGMHPSDLPAYAGGSPIQNQVLDGLTVSKATMFRLSPEMDAGPILAQREFSLEGHIDDIFRRLSASTFIMCVELLDRWPNVKERAQEGHKDVRRRIKPEASRLSREQLSQLTCRQLWDVIRCREDPYPNVYLEDDTGRLVIKRAEFESK